MGSIHRRTRAVWGFTDQLDFQPHQLHAKESCKKPADLPVLTGVPIRAMKAPSAAHWDSVLAGEKPGQIGLLCFHLGLSPQSESCPLAFCNLLGPNPTTAAPFPEPSTQYSAFVEPAWLTPLRSPAPEHECETPCAVCRRCLSLRRLQGVTLDLPVHTAGKTWADQHVGHEQQPLCWHGQ